MKKLTQIFKKGKIEIKQIRNKSQWSQNSLLGSQKQTGLPVTEIFILIQHRFINFSTQKTKLLAKNLSQMDRIRLRTVIYMSYFVINTF